MENFVLLVTTIVLWLIALTTPGWLIRSSTDHKLGHTSDMHASVFYIGFCRNMECTYMSYYGNCDDQELLASVFESQVETLVVFILYGISCILVTLPDSRCNRKCILSVVTFTLIIAETTALMVIFRMCVANAVASIFASDGVFIHSPYSIFFAGFSLVVGIIALVLNYVALSSLNNRDETYFGLASGEQHIYNQILEGNFRGPNEANEDVSLETNNMAEKNDYLELLPEEQHVYNQIARMKRATLVFVLLLTTIVLWLIAMTTPGWSVVSDRHELSLDVQASVFYIKFCNQQECTYMSYYNDMPYLVIAGVFEFQMETLLAFVLFGISCILLMLPDSCSCNKKCTLSSVTVILVIAETTALTVIFRMYVVNAFASIFASDDFFIHFPYSIFFAVFSFVVGIIALVFNYVDLRSLINNRDAANDQHFGLAPGDHHDYNQVLEDNFRRLNEANEDFCQETNSMSANDEYFGIAPGDHHDYNQVLEDNFRRPNEANEDFSQETNNMAANYQYLGLAPEEQHVYNQVPQENPRIPNEANEDLPEKTNKMA